MFSILTAALGHSEMKLDRLSTVTHWLDEGDQAVSIQALNMPTSTSACFSHLSELILYLETEEKAIRSKLAVRIALPLCSDISANVLSRKD